MKPCAHSFTAHMVLQTVAHNGDTKTVHMAKQRISLAPIDSTHLMQAH
jgi:hypothetical protein